MPHVVSVRLRYNPKPLWFDPQGQSFSFGTEVLVETERGREVGVILDPAIDATDAQISKLKSPLKPVIRELTDLDREHVQALEEKGRAAMPAFREKVEEYDLDIKPVEVQYLFSGERAIFYFSSEERVDFRELVRDLAQHFHVRIDMRQIGARDEAKELGGIAHCGEEFCCTRFGGEFQPVSIRMAKEQDLPLNPSKISGVCGRLMCCLRYEYEAYKDFKKRAPKKGTPVDTPLGDAIISGYNTPSEMMEIRLEDGKKINVPLAEMNCKKGRDGCSRCSVGHDTIERCASQSTLIALGVFERQLDEGFASRETELEGDVAVQTGQSERRRRRRSGKAEGASGEATDAAASGGSGRTPRRSGASSAAGDSARTPRRSSRGTEARGGAAARGPALAASVSVSAERPSEGERSKRSRRRRKGDKSGNTQSAQNTQNAAATPASSDAAAFSSSGSTKKPRPGQRSSGLRRQHAKGGEKGAPTERSAAEQPAVEQSRLPDRKPRRRTPQHAATSQQEAGAQREARPQQEIRASEPQADTAQTDRRRRRRRSGTGATGENASGDA